LSAIKTSAAILRQQGIGAGEIMGLSRGHQEA
jgi:hypothetical protein